MKEEILSNDINNKSKIDIKKDINNIEYISDDTERNKFKKFEISSDSIDNNNESIPENNDISLNQSVANNSIFNQLIEFGYDSLFSKRIIQYFHPQNIEEALDYLSKENKIIQHHFIQKRNKNDNKCYVCGEQKEIHLGFFPEDINSNSVSIIIKNKNNNNDIENNDVLNINYKRNKENILVEKNSICQICSENFISFNENTVKKCGHSFCNSCWYDFLSIKIKENKIVSIKCLDYECQEKLSDKFIINLLNNDYELIKKFKRFKSELEILNDPNKKLCPFPECDSYLELKDIKNKNVTCLNNHTFCFLCLQKPHGKLPCNGNLDISMIEFGKKHFVKKCPKCSIITEKTSGCNHIICSKCNYEWCWLCNGKYINGHYNEGKCKGYQFFKPQDEYDIKLAFEGKIQLNESQIQHDLNNFVNENNINIVIRINNMDDRIMEFYQGISCRKKFLVLFLYIIFGHLLYSIGNIPNRYMERFDNNLMGNVKYFLNGFLIIISYFWLQIIFLFFMIFYNIIMLLPYLIIGHFSEFIYHSYHITRNNKFAIFFYNFIIFILFTFFGGILIIQYIKESIIGHYGEGISFKIREIIHILIAFVYLIIYFPLQVFINLINLLLFIIYNGSSFIDIINNNFEEAFGVRFYNLNY